MAAFKVPKASLICPLAFLYKKWHPDVVLICLLASSIRRAFDAPISSEPVVRLIEAMCAAVRLLLVAITVVVISVSIKGLIILV